MGMQAPTIIIIIINNSRIYLIFDPNFRPRSTHPDFPPAVVVFVAVVSVTVVVLLPS
jgi:hypothetical protein